MKKQQGYTLLETLIAMLIIAALGASGLYGWQGWQQQQRLWQTASQVRDYLLQLRDDANWRNRDHVISVVRDGTSWCFVSSAALQTTCRPVSSLVFTPLWDDVEMAEITPFTGLFWPAQYGMDRTYSPEKCGRRMARGGVWLGADQAL